MTTTWPFDDPPDTASFTTTFVLAGAPVLRVYHEFGYDLEDAVWLANYRSDLHPPSEELRNNLDIGAGQAVG